MDLFKTIADDLATLDALLARQEAKVRRAFATFLLQSTDPAVVKQVTELVAAGNIEGALSVVDSHIVKLSSVLPTIFQDAAAAEVASLAPTMARINPSVAVSFDPFDGPAADMMRRNTLAFITNFSEQQRTTTRDALIAQFETGGGTQATARAYRSSIGLTPGQARAVANYRRLLEEGSGQALDRALRDRRYDRTVERAVDTGQPLKQDQIDRMVDRYRQRMLAMRAETIARTESVRTAAQAREAAFLQMIQQTGIDPARVRQTWRATMDNRVRDTHRAMNGQVRPLGQAFDSPSGARLRYPGDPTAPASECVNCRCAVTFTIAPIGVTTAV
jgi:hypothetical protein